MATSDSIVGFSGSSLVKYFVIENLASGYRLERVRENDTTSEAIASTNNFLHLEELLIGDVIDLFIETRFSTCNGRGGKQFAARQLQNGW